MEIKGIDEAKNDFVMLSELSNDFRWRVNAMKSGSGPVLLLHFPLYQSGKTHLWEGSTFKSIIDSSGNVPASAESKGFSKTDPYDLSQTVPANATEYIFHALKPRIVFSAHTHEFSVYTHPDGTQEVTIPAMTWEVRDDPGFIVATFQRNKSIVRVTYCSVARESHILIAYTSALVLFVFFIIISNTLESKGLS
ncbi:hypothetical protein GQ457_13G010020 [Hibiscus cannabinus]